MKLSGKNFQSWPEFSLDLKGFVVMIGPSRAGKSNIFRALKGLLRNEIPEQRVRVGTNETELTLEIDEGTRIRARRPANGSTKYKINDEKELTSLAKGLPDALTNLKVGAVKIGDYTIDPIFASQFGDQFMLETSGPTELNTILGAFASTEKLETGKKQANLLITQKNSEAKTLAEQIGDAEELRDRLVNLLTTGTSVETSLRLLEPQIRHSEALGYWLGQCTIIQVRLVPLQAIVASLTIPDTIEAERLQQKSLCLVSAAKAQGRIFKLEMMGLGLEDTINQWSDIVALSRRAKAVNETANFSSLIERACELDAARKLNGLIGELEGDLTSAIDLQASIKYTGQAVLLIQRVADKKAALIQLETNLKELQEKHGLCSKCGEPLEHFCGS